MSQDGMIGNTAGLAPDDLAEACAQAMWKNDRASQGLDMQIEHVAAGTATLSMRVRESMVNGHDICHGGYIFTLADSAFAFACNSYNDNTVAQHCSITYIAPARLGERLTATAIEQTRFGRNGIYDVTVRRDDGQEIARFRGHSRTIRGTHLPVCGDTTTGEAVPADAQPGRGRNE